MSQVTLKGSLKKQYVIHRANMYGRVLAAALAMSVIGTSAFETAAMDFSKRCEAQDEYDGADANCLASNAN